MLSSLVSALKLIIWVCPIIGIIGTVHLSKRLDKNNCDSHFIVFTLRCLISYVLLGICYGLKLAFPDSSITKYMEIGVTGFTFLIVVETITLIVMTIASGVAFVKSENIRKKEEAAEFSAEIKRLDTLIEQLRTGTIPQSSAKSESELEQQYRNAVEESQYVRNKLAIEKAIDLLVDLGNYKDSVSRAIESVEVLKQLKIEEHQMHA